MILLMFFYCIRIRCYIRNAGDYIHTNRDGDGGDDGDAEVEYVRNDYAHNGSDDSDVRNDYFPEPRCVPR